MAKISKEGLCQHLDKYLHVDHFTDYCPNGMQVEGKDSIEKIATAVSASEETLLKAVEWGADALIVHHGLFWNLDSYIVAGSKRRKLDLILRNNLNLLAYHLPLDAHETLGNNWKAARDLGISQRLPFCVEGKIALGVKGRVDPIHRDDFRKELEEYYEHPAHTAFGKKEFIEQVAIISGGAYKFMTQAAVEGIDAFVTGNFDEPAWHIAKEENLLFYALGHSATEVVGPKALADYIQEAFDVKTTFLDISNPF